jgi:hypothetical protein
MPTSLQELSDFHQFAMKQIRNGGADLSLEELLDFWRVARPDDEELRESLASLERGLGDIQAGRVHTARKVIEELKKGLPAVPDA